MKIGIMLRSIDEKGGVGVYTQNIVEELLEIDGNNQYILYFRTAQNMDRFATHHCVRHRLIPSSNKAYWDQVVIPRACRQDGIDVLFHPKFTVPLLAPCKTVMVVHGADWFMPEQAQYYGWLDVQYIRTVMPFYFRKCSKVISVSQLTTENFNQVLNLPADKVKTVYFGPARHFTRIEDGQKLAEVRTRYKLPEHFILTLTKRSGGRRKNVGAIFEAYKLYHAQSNSPLPLVVGGKDCHLFRTEYQIPLTGYGADIHFPGWLEQNDLPAIYSLAHLYLYPSNLEAFPIPITEAMACGTAIVTSNVNGLKEIAGDAAIFVDPQNTVEIANVLQKVAEDPQLRLALSAKGLNRAKQFSWRRCAIETLQILEEVKNLGHR